MTKPWLKQYPTGVPAAVGVGRFSSPPARMEEAFGQHRDRTAHGFTGRSMSCGQLEEFSHQLAAHLQPRGIGTGGRVAVMPPGVPQYPVRVAGVNPLHSPGEVVKALRRELRG